MTGKRKRARRIDVCLSSVTWTLSSSNFLLPSTSPPCASTSLPLSRLPLYPRRYHATVVSDASIPRLRQGRRASWRATDTVRGQSYFIVAALNVLMCPVLLGHFSEPPSIRMTRSVSRNAAVSRRPSPSTLHLTLHTALRPSIYPFYRAALSLWCDRQDGYVRYLYVPQHPDLRNPRM